MLRPETERVCFRLSRPPSAQSRHFPENLIDAANVRVSPWSPWRQNRSLAWLPVNLMAAVALGQEDLCVLPAFFDGFCVMMGGGGLLKTDTCVWRVI